MNIFRFYCLCTFIVLCNWDGIASAQVVEIPDPNLERAIREELGLSSEVPVTQQEMLRLRKLHAEQRDITDLTGLKSATNLKSLILNFNQIVDFSPLSGLINLGLMLVPKEPEKPTL